MTPKPIIYTDGACKGNGNQNAAGGFGVLVCYPDGKQRHIWGGEPATTNNRMELMAAIVALDSTQGEPAVQLFTDSTYVFKGITQWIKNWKTKHYKDVKNPDLWQRLDAACQGRNIDWQWVKGHAGHDGNETADQLANKGINGQGDEWVTNLPSHQPNNPPTSTYQHTNTMTNLDTPMPAYDGDTSRANPYFVPILPPPKNRHAPERQLIMDTETTGFEDQNGDRIVEIGMIELVGRKFTGEKLHVYLNPDKIMDDEVIRVHGISNEFLADKPRFADVADKVYEFMQGAELVAHNASFDMRFLQMEFSKAGYLDFDKNVSVLDTLVLAKQRYPGQKNSLDALVKRLDVGKQDRTFHGALLDSEILAEVYLAMTGGQVALAIDEEQTTQQEDHKHDNLSALAHLLVRTYGDHGADSAWRASVLG